MRKYFKRILLRLVNGQIICPKCLRMQMRRGYYTRGWNNLCDQATGDNGYRCYNCGHMVWDHTLEEYKERLPKWCKAYNMR